LKVKYSIMFGLWICLCLGAGTALAIEASQAKDIAGSIEVEVDGQAVVFGAMTSDYAVDVRGDIAHVKLTQRFVNPFNRPLHARYLFPLTSNAAVHGMQMAVGDEIIEAVIEEKVQAQKTFTAAMQAGKAASLLTQHRPNMFTQRIANLMPGLPIDVTIEYTHNVLRVDGAYELLIPLVVGPRFQPAGAGKPPDADSSSSGGSSEAGTWQLETLPVYPATAGVDVAHDAVAPRVSLNIELEAQVPIGVVTSATHALEIEHRSSTQQSIRLVEGKVLDDRDFVMRYALTGTSPAAGLLSHWESGEGGYFSLLIEPPAEVADAAALRREMVFLLDCSGSMSGLPMEASKRFMTQALRALRPGDHFRIIRFSDAATEFSTQPLPATPENVAQGVRYVRSLYGQGGTMMTSGIDQALSASVVQGAVRNVVFLTDGYIGNEHTVLQLVAEKLGDARLFAFGVGTGVNRYLMNELGRVGRGFTRYFDPTRDEQTMEEVVAGLVDKLQTPVLTDLSIDWGQLAVSDVVPAKLPDLYAGDSVRVSGRYQQTGTADIVIHGRARTGAASITTRLNLDRETTRPSIRFVWARQTIAERMHDFITPNPLRADGVTNDQLQATVTALGLTYGLTTRWTSFVAVSRARYNKEPDDAVAADVALPKVAGVSPMAYAKPAFTGSGTPEPGVWLSLLIVALSLLGLRSLRATAR
jgi:Ca-activated chloride channel family protein